MSECKTLRWRSTLRQFKTTSSISFHIFNNKNRFCLVFNEKGSASSANGKIILKSKMIKITNLSVRILKPATTLIQDILLEKNTNDHHLLKYML